MKVTKTAAAVTATLAVLAGAGCGSAASIAGSSSATLTKQDFAAALGAAVSGSQSVHLSGTVVIKGKTVTLSADAGTQGTSPRDDAMSLVVHAPPSGTLQMRIVDGAAYLNVNVPGLPRAPSTKPWLKLDLHDPHSPFGSAFAHMAQLGPGDLMREFRALSSVTTIGSQTVDGVPTTHYRVTLDATKLGASMGVPPGRDIPRLSKSLGFDVWVDSASRPVEMKTTIATMSADLHFSKWGEPVHVVAPPASEVTVLGDSQA